MFSFKKLEKNEPLFFRFTGISVENFKSFFEKIKKEYESFELKRLSRPNREKAIGQGNNFKYKLKERIVITLFYYRVYTTMDFLAFFIDLDKSNVSRNITMLEKIIKKVIPLPKKIYSDKNKIKTEEGLLELFPELKVIVDATEQKINRPKNKKRRDNHFSGKKKIYSKKVQITINKDGLIVHKTKSANGKKHDKKLFEEDNLKIPKEVIIEGDSGFQGIDELVENEVVLPRKKQKGKERKKEDKRFNKKLSKSRILVENVIGKLKQFGLMKERYRNKFEDYDKKIEIIIGLVNLRTQERIKLKDEGRLEENIFVF
jgi:DDE superfamily endonuclease